MRGARVWCVRSLLDALAAVTRTSPYSTVECHGREGGDIDITECHVPTALDAQGAADTITIGMQTDQTEKQK
jgi:hypothetical protein